MTEFQAIAANCKDEFCVGFLQSTHNTYKVFFVANLSGGKLPQKHDRVFLLHQRDSEFIIPVVGFTQVGMGSWGSRALA